MRLRLGRPRRLLLIITLWVLVLTAFAPTITRALQSSLQADLYATLALASWCSTEHAGEGAGSADEPGNTDTGLVSCPACLVPLQTALLALPADVSAWLRHDLRTAAPRAVAAADHACRVIGLAWARAPPRA